MSQPYQNFNTYRPYNPYGYPSAPYMPYPQAGVGAVTINIQNPTVKAGNETIKDVNTSSAATPVVTKTKAPQIKKEIKPEKAIAAKNISNSEKKVETKKPEPKKEEKFKESDSSIPNEHIKNIELSLQNNKIIGIQELRKLSQKYEGKRLNNLLNLSLSMKSSPAIRLSAMMMLKSGNINGDDLTVKLLKEIMKSKVPGEADDAYNTLMALSGRRLNVSLDDKSAAAPLTNEKEVGQKLNIVSN